MMLPMIRQAIPKKLNGKAPGYGTGYAEMHILFFLTVLNRLTSGAAFC